MRALVTGGAGFIGSHIAGALRERGDDVVVLDDLSGGFEENVPCGAKLIVGSVTNAPLVDALFEQHRFDVVYHLAAYAAEGLSHWIRHYNYTTNVLGSINLINAAVRHGVHHFVFTSSMAVYGASQVPFREDMPPAPDDPYGIAKLAVEQDLAVALRTFGLGYTVFRPHNVYGEQQNLWDRHRNVVGIFLRQALRGEQPTIFGDGTQQRAFSYVGDIVGPMLDCVGMLAADGEVFNIGGDQPTTVNDLAATVICAVGADIEPIYLPAREEVHLAYSDHAKLREVFGDSAQTPFLEGLDKMVAWARGALRRPRAVRDFWALELEDGLPEAWAKYRRPHE